MILFVKTDSNDAEIGLYVDGKVVACDGWAAGRELSDNLLKHIEQMLAGLGKNWKSLNGIVVFKGPGSFTGLRIGITVANTLSYSLSIPIIGSSGDDWLTSGVDLLANGENEQTVIPEYGHEANITKPRK